MNNSTKAAIPAAIAIALAGLGANGAPTADHCYDFSRMSEDASYSVGDVIETDFATITLKPYTFNGSQVDPVNSHANRVQSQIAGGTSPELELKLIALNIAPKKPVTRITTQIAQNFGHEGQYADSGLGVNRKGVKTMDGFNALDGKVVGRPRTGKAEISADISHNGGNGYWHTGTLEFNAVKGSIESIRLGAHTWRLDNMCFTY